MDKIQFKKDNFEVQWPILYNDTISNYGQITHSNAILDGLKKLSLW